MLVLGLAAATPALADGVLSPRGPIAEANRAILLNSLAVMLVIVVPTILAAFAIAWWFRAGNPRASYDPTFTYSGRIEAVVWGIPLLTIIFLSGLIWTGSHRLDPYRPIATSELEVQVVALDWKWLFIYPTEGVASVNRLVVPVGRPVHFSLTSAGVMNAFFVPQLGSQVYAMNGMTTQLHLQADRAGTYRGLSSQFSGDGFADMGFAAQAVTPEAFSLWARATRARGPVLDAAAYAGLARQTRGYPAVTFAPVQAGLFESIARRERPTRQRPEVKRADGRPASAEGGQ